MELKDKIRRYKTLSEIAERLNTSQPNITQKIKRKSLSYSELEKIAEVCGCSLSELVADNVCNTDTGNKVALRCPHCGENININIEK